MFKFSTLSLLLLAVPCAFAVTWARGIYAGRAPIAWETYSPMLRDMYLQKGKRVLVAAKPSYDVGTSVAVETLQDPRIRRSFYCGHFVALEAEYSDWEDELAESLFSDVGFKQGSFVVLYTPTAPPILLDPYDADEILRHIPSPSLWYQAIMFFGSLLGILAIWAWRMEKGAAPKKIWDQSKGEI